MIKVTFVRPFDKSDKEYVSTKMHMHHIVCNKTLPNQSLMMVPRYASKRHTLKPWHHWISDKKISRNTQLAPEKIRNALTLPPTCPRPPQNQTWSRSECSGGPVLRKQLEPATFASCPWPSESPLRCPISSLCGDRGRCRRSSAKQKQLSQQQ